MAFSSLPAASAVAAARASGARGAQEAGQMPAATPQEKLAAQGVTVRSSSGSEKAGADRDSRRNPKGRAAKPRSGGGDQTAAKRRGTGTLLDTVV